jgi:Predicted AAA-ATPase/PD-(D/E)XK nuclease superfamily
MRKEFNITGNCFPKLHYMADVSHKMTETIELIEKGKYFIINRPRQYGKTTTLYALAHALRQKGDYIALNMSFEAVGEDAYVSEMSFARKFLRLMTKAARLEEKPLFSWISQHPPEIHSWDDLSDFISEMADRFPQKVVLLIDEVDQSSNNDIFIRFLAFLRNKFLARNAEPTFHSVILAGVHDVKTLKLKIRSDSEQKLNSPWNIAAPFNVDMNLHPHEIKPMLADYIRETGVQMDTDLMSYGLFRYTSGYPFLVSRLCKMLDEDLLHTKTVKSWTLDDLETAVKQLVEEANTNFESLVKHLEDYPQLYDLVYKIAIEGESLSFNPHDIVVNIGITHGFFTKRNHRIAIHNRIYQEVLVNYMTFKLHRMELMKGKNFANGYRNADKTLNMEAVLFGFQSLLKEQYSKNDRDFLERQGRLVFLAFLRPILNGAGYDFKEVQVSEEKRLDVVITYYACKYVVELKRWYGPKLHEEGLLQLADYLDIQNLKEGYLVVFDNKQIKSWSHDATIVNGKRIFMIWV